MIRSAIFFLLCLPFFAVGQNPLIPKRLEKVQLVIPLVYNDVVEASINKLTLNTNNSTSILLGKSAVYLPGIEDSLNKYKLPTELRFLMPALSGYDNWLVSEDGGSGYWQMRYLVAKKYGLNLSSYVDERRDYKAATSAALKNLKDLFQIYGDWQLTIAAYYSDETEVNKAIRMAGGQKDYWKIHPYLPARFQSTIPNFVASVYVHSYYQMHTIVPTKYQAVQTEAVPITQWTTIFQMSRALEMDFDLLKDLNAIYKKQVIPRTKKQYFLNVPFDKVSRFYALGDSVYTFGVVNKDDTIEVPKAVIPTPVVQEPKEKPVTQVTTSGNKELYYVVKRGDFLGKIADLYDVNISELRKWNGIKGDHIAVNQRIKVLVPAAEFSKYSKINGMTAAQKQQIVDKD